MSRPNVLVTLTNLIALMVVFRRETRQFDYVNRVKSEHRLRRIVVEPTLPCARDVSDDLRLRLAGRGVVYQPLVLAVCANGSVCRIAEYLSDLDAPCHYRVALFRSDTVSKRIARSMMLIVRVACFARHNDLLLIRHSSRYNRSAASKEQRIIP